MDLFLASGVGELAHKFGVRWELLIAQAINFCIVTFILYRFAFRPVLKTVDERQKKISDGLQYAEEMKLKLAETEKDRDEALKQAALEARKLVEEAKVSAHEYTEKQHQRAAHDSENIIKKAEETIQRERNQMMSELRREVADLVVDTTQKVLNRELSTSEQSDYAETAARELDLAK